jgi:L-seryl-tRNA(Ser) seleniumtransferase
LDSESLRQLPSVDQLLNAAERAGLIGEHGREMVLNAARAVLEQARAQIAHGSAALPDSREHATDLIVGQIAGYLQEAARRSLRRAVNATGIIIHTGLGRAVLPRTAAEAVAEVLGGYCNLAVDPDTGQRGHRDSHVVGLLCELTGAEAATMVNNNAAATMIILNTLAKGKEVIVSRGQLVEIGGSFRMPEVMEGSGTILREVGTTNKTYLSDYLNAIGDNTGAILRVHQSNYRIIGFTEQPPLEDLVRVGHEHNLPVIDDLGSGALLDMKDFGLAHEPMVQESIRAGADVVCFSGDKLIGGPQAGVIVGQAAVIEKIKKNPLARALRVGKMTISALEATLRLFLSRDRLLSENPTYRMLSLPLSELDERAKSVAEALREVLSGVAEIAVIDGASEVGSGSVPAEEIPTRLLSVRPTAVSTQTLARSLRHYAPPIFARVHKDAVLFDFRTLQAEEDAIVCAALRALLANEATSE